MSLIHSRLTEVAYVASSLTSVYANPTTTKSHVRGFLLYNSNTTAEVIEIHWVPDSAGSVGTGGATTIIFKVTLAANETQIYEIPYGLVMLDHNETIQMKTTTASKVNCLVLGDLDQ